MKKLIRKSEQLYNRLVQLYPQKFKRQFAEEMKFVFSESLREAYERDGNMGIAVLWAWTLIDLAASLFKEHWRERKGDHPMVQKPTLFAGIGTGVLRQPSARKKEYEFHVDNGLVGTLRWPNAFRSVCIAEAADGTWTFQRHGILKPLVIARAVDSDQDLLILNSHWTGMRGTIEHQDGRTFLLREVNWWGGRFKLVQKSAHGEDVELLTVKVNFSLLRGSADVEVQPALSQMKDAALLTMFSCYWVLMTYEEMSGMSGVAVTSAAVTVA
jgi:hypothetical protein